ncbi:MULTISPECIES: L,D-transpeptidase family protein [Nocardioides]|uniref:L,D-transpeptidase family protein n=1 Tax=Nocardioides vastitatis TaxID=2568655 RepID=A0ABW0ZFD3_9ACTN|nr:L,D-transpeptidase family protein [Nocardioides sp.]THJ00484.1 murein L,D-transpeptidase [Nocardioides sp.]
MNTKLLVARRITLLTVVAAVCSVLAYGAGWAARSTTLPWDEAPRPAGAPMDDGPAAMAGGEPAQKPAQQPAQQPEHQPAEDQPAEPEQLEVPGPALLVPGAEGDRVRDLQARLKQIDWFHATVTGFYGDVTTEAVRGFQAKRGIAVTGEVDQRTLDRLHRMTRAPSRAELTGQPPPSGANRPGALDSRCTTGRALCVDKSSRTLRWVVDGEVRRTVDVRFGSSELPTREGAFSVQRKSREHVSSLYHTPMPYAMFFSGGQAVHYSPDFAATGYDGASHGCVNVRDEEAVAWLYEQVQVGDRVIVYWSRELSPRR